MLCSRSTRADARGQFRFDYAWHVAARGRSNCRSRTGRVYAWIVAALTRPGVGGCVHIGTLTVHRDIGSEKCVLLPAPAAGPGLTGGNTASTRARI